MNGGETPDDGTTGPRHIAIVEDDQATAMLYRMLVTQNGGEVTVIMGNFGQLTEAPWWSGIDVALVDRFLIEPVSGSGEHYDGLDLLSWLGENHPDIHRILLTGDQDVAFQSLPADEILIKPVSPVVLLQKLGLAHD
jgi:DNA-binding NtrC family response regulator